MEITSPVYIFPLRIDSVVRDEKFTHVPHPFPFHSSSIRLPFLSLFPFFLSLFASPRSSNSPGAMQPGIGDFLAATWEREKERKRKSDGRKIRRFTGEARLSKRRETEIKSKRKKRKKREREKGREREGFVAGIYFSSSISQAGYRIRDGYLYACKVIAPGWRTSASAICRVHLIAKVHPPSHPPSPLPTPLSRRLWR